MNDAVAMPTDDALRALAQRCVIRATDKGITFVTAESCTGGLVAHLVTEIPGASTAFLGGWVVYSNHRKVEDLGVDAQLVEAHGAVSAPVAEQLASRARVRAGATFGVATTGIAGPTGATQGKPIGTVWLGLATSQGAQTECFTADPANDRTANKRAFAARALELLACAIEDHRADGT